MNDRGLLLIYKARPHQIWAWELFECLTDEERNRLWDLLYKECNDGYVEKIDRSLSNSLSEIEPIKQEVKK